ncbi:MAG: hypothetical protein GY796_12660 [Chloroflexi bacterium]|nr:hypothetical protein [Chloroflexota bacterium]
MKFIADEGIDVPVVVSLRQENYQIWYVAEMSPGISDEAIYALANQEKAVLITADKDFGDIVFRQRKAAYGVILLRLHGLPLEQKADWRLFYKHTYNLQSPTPISV